MAGKRSTSARSAWFPVVGYVALVFTLSSIPASRLPLFPGMDKLIHLGEYGVLGGLLVRALSTVPRLNDPLMAGGVAVALGMIVSVADELYQGRIPGRDASLLDGIADLLGLTLAQLAWAWSRRPPHAMEGR